MLTALDPKKLVYIFAALLGVGAFIEWASIGFSAIYDYGLIAFISKSISISVIIAAILGHHAVIDWIWRRIPLLNLVVPNLNGTFELKNCSNWNIKKQMLDAFNGVPPSGEMQEPSFTVMGTLNIKMGLFRIRMSYLPAENGPSRSRSEVLSASIHADPHSDFYRVDYIYKATVAQPSRETDEQAFYGAAQFQLVKESGLPSRMDGHYWTNRAWNRGLNTAGTLIVERIT
jgi:hypothetical protein